MKLMTDSFNRYTKYIDKDTGFLHISGVIARTGIQEYYGLELQDSEAVPMQKYNVYRPKEEVLNKDSLKTFINATVTDDHPNQLVSIDNIKELGKGSSSGYEIVSEDGIDYVKTNLIITDKDLIYKIMDGKIEISAGYTQNLVKESGNFNGVDYQYKQTDIKINHIAIVDAGRCGVKCKIMTDSKSDIMQDVNTTKGGNMKKIKIGDSEIEICDTVDSHIKGLESKLSDSLKQVETLKAQNDALVVEIEKEEEENKEKEMMDSMINEKVEVMVLAKDLNLSIDSKLSLIDMKKSIIGQKNSISLDNKSNDYIDAMFDMVKVQIDSDNEKKKKIEDSHRKASENFDSGVDEKSTFLNLKDKEL